MHDKDNQEHYLHVQTKAKGTYKSKKQEPKQQFSKATGFPRGTTLLQASRVNERAKVLLQEWSEKNTFTPSDVTASSHKKPIWSCGKGHEYQASVHNRMIRYSGCPYCAGKLAWPGESDLGTLYPQLAKEWSDKNSDTPQDVRPGTYSFRWWVCSKGHEWEAYIKDRTSQSQGCPFCSGRRVSSGETDLATVFPEIANFYSTENIVPVDKVNAYSNYRFFWECSNGHKWKQSVDSIVQNWKRETTLCKSCRSGLEFRFPEIAAEYSARNSVPVSEVVRGAVEKVWWDCPNGHEYEASPNSRTNSQFRGGSGCPKCAKAGPTSHIEQRHREALALYIDDVPDTHKNYIEYNEKTFQVDAVGSFKGVPVVFEYDGYRFHEAETEKDTARTLHLLSKGYIVLRLRDFPLTELEIDDPNLIQVTQKWSRNPWVAIQSIQKMVYLMDKRLSEAV